MINALEIARAVKPYVMEWITASLSPSQNQAGEASDASPADELAPLLLSYGSLGASPSARVLEAGLGISFSDAGPGGAVTSTFDTTANLAITGAHSYLGDKLTFIDGLTGLEAIGRIYSEKTGTYSNFPTFGAYNEMPSSNAAVELFAQRLSGGYAAAGIAVISGNTEAATKIVLSINLNETVLIRDTTIQATQTAAATGSPNALLFTAGAHTTLTASTEAIDINFNLARTVQFSTGAITTQRAFLVQAPTYAAVGASTITNAATVAITGAPVAGTNVTLTNTFALWVQAGAVKFGGTLTVTGIIDGSAAGVRTKPNAGAPSSLTSGDLVVDTTNERLYVQVGSTLEYVQTGVAGVHGAVHASSFAMDDGAGGAKNLTSGSTVNSADLRGSNGVPSDAKEVDLILYGKSATDTVNLIACSADDTPDSYHPALASLAGKWLKIQVRVALGTGGNAGKVTFKASGDAWDFWATVVGWYR